MTKPISGTDLWVQQINDGKKRLDTVIESFFMQSTHTDADLISGILNRVTVENESKQKWTRVVCDLLIPQHMNDYDKNDTAFAVAIKRGYLETVKLLMPKKMLSRHQELGIICAARSGQADVLKFLLDDGRIHPSINDNQAIQWAATYGHTEVVRALLADRRMKKVGLSRALKMAVKKNRLEVVELLREHATHLSYALESAIQHNRIQALKILMQSERITFKKYKWLPITAINHGKQAIINIFFYDRRFNSDVRSPGIQ